MPEQGFTPSAFLERRRQEQKRTASKAQEKAEEVIDEARINALKNDPRYRRFLEHTPEGILGNRINDVVYALDEANREFVSEPDTELRFTRILLDHDIEALRENSRRQFEAMQHFRRTYAQNVEEEAGRLQDFVGLVHGMRPVRADKAGSSYAQFESPRRIGSVSSFGGQDAIVQADRYIYGSLDGIRHYMAASKQNTHTLDEQAIEGTAEIVMQDIANVIARDAKRPIAHYLDNLFDYQTGKEILAQYLATVFTTPEEAVRFLSRNNSPLQAQRWDVGMLNPVCEDVQYLEGEDEDVFRKNIKKAEDHALRRAEEIAAMMQKILEATGIEPPLSLEVRIPDVAPIAR